MLTSLGEAALPAAVAIDWLAGFGLDPGLTADESLGSGSVALAVTVKPIAGEAVLDTPPGVLGFVVAHPVGCAFGTLESLAEVRRVEFEGDEESRGVLDSPTLRATGRAGETIGLAFSRKRLFTLREVNFLGCADCTEVVDSSCDGGCCC